MSYFRQTVATGTAHVKDIGVGKFGAKLVTFGNGLKAILKFKAFGTGTFRSVPKQALHQRELAAYQLARDVFKWSVVPETMLVRRDGREASMQHYRHGVQARDLVPGIFDRKLPDWKYRIAKLFSMVNVDDLLKIVVFDMVINNADRHARNVIFDTIGHRVWAIDNGLSFGPAFKNYRNVFHKYLFLRKLELPEEVEEKLKSITRSDLNAPLRPYLSAKEIDHVYWRIQFIVEHKDKLDFLRLSQGHMGPNDFPSYEAWFEKKAAPPVDDLSLVLDLEALPGWKTSTQA